MSGNVDAKTLLTSLNADFYEFIISNDPDAASNTQENNNNNDKNNGNTPPKLQPLE